MSERFEVVLRDGKFGVSVNNAEPLQLFDESPVDIECLESGIHYTVKGEKHSQPWHSPD
jgi:hypothetical protein